MGGAARERGGAAAGGRGRGRGSGRSRAGGAAGEQGDGGLAKARARIDALDSAIVALLATRAGFVEALWADKRAAGLPVRDPLREAAVFERLRLRALAAGLDPVAVERVFREIVGVDLRG